MDLVKEIRGALDLAATYFNENPAVGWTEWTREVHRRVGALAPRYAEAHAIACGQYTQQSLGGKRVCVCIAGGLEPAIARSFIFDQCWLIMYDNQHDTEDGYTTNLPLVMESEWIANHEAI